MKRLAPVSALVVALMMQSSAQLGVAETSDGLARMRIRITSSSDWVSVELDHLDVRARHTVSTAFTQTVWDRFDGWTVVRAGGTTNTAVVVLDLIADVGSEPAPSLVVSKGREGIARVEVLATNGTAPQPAADVVLETHDPRQNLATTGIDRDVLVQDQLVLPEVDGRNLALAFYYPWFRADAASDPKVNPDKPASWYATDDREHIRGTVAEATGAGLDGFLVSWQGDLHGEVVDRLLDEVEQRPGFVVAPVLELRGLRTKTLLGDQFDPAAAARALTDFVQRVPRSSRLEVAGRPVVVAFGMWDLQPAEWDAFRAGVTGLNPFIIGDRAEPGFLIDGFYTYDPNPLSIDQMESTYADSVDRARLQPAVDPSARQLLWAATVSPGFDNGGSTLLLGRRFTDRASGWRYDQTWRVAVDSRPEWIFVTSWNEWYEQTHISPGRSTGRAALDQTTAWTDRFHTSPQ